MTFIRRFWKSQDGTTAIEYGLIGSLLSIAVIVGAAAIGVELTGVYDAVKDKVVAALGD